MQGFMMFMYWSVTDFDNPGYMILIIQVREGILRKNCCSFGFCPNEGGGRALTKFFGAFS